MKWNHLPVAGGLYDQDPELIRRFEIIFRELHDHEKSEAEKERRKHEASAGKSGSRRVGSRIKKR